VLVPPFIKRMDRAAWAKETADLNTIADDFTLSILRSKSIPDGSGWAAFISTNQSSLPVAAIGTNPRRYARAFLVDPSLRINGAALPYTQTANGSTQPISARVMILSSIGRDLPLGIGSGVATA